jgi:small subunit ribosomal protein S16
MPVKIRLQRKGRKQRPFYHIVVADARAPRDGKFISKLGTYNPMTKPATIDINREEAYEWLMKGAQPTDTVRAILRFKGVMYRKHLMRGVAKEALTQEEADQKWQEWIDSKEAKVTERRNAALGEISEFHAARFGEVPTIVEEAPVEEEVKEIPTIVEETPAKEAATEEAEAPAAEVEAPVAEEAAPAAEAKESKDGE